LDLGVPQMAFGRIALLGDAAFIPRPHTAASVSKGAANAIALVDALANQNYDVPEALNVWETDQLRLGMHLWKTGQDLGERSQFMYGKDRFDEPTLQQA
jgi:2-polyprenyl-6-methoxyphenol hydroxylase-like FAD-dependent oxidoreductase